MSERQDVAANDRTLFERLATEGTDEENLIVSRGAHCYVVMNLYPYNNGHLMVVPYRRVADFDALSSDEQIEIARMIGDCTRWLRSALRAEGFNVGMNLGSAAGAGVPDHLHIHIVPRWSGDTNFMPAIAETKVIPEDLSVTYGKIRAAVEADQ